MKLIKQNVGVWVKASELKEINWPICIKYDGGGADYYETVASMEELWKITSAHNPLTEVEWLKPIDKAELKQDTEFEKITGFKAPEEHTAYNKGRDDEQEVCMKFIREWDGETNSRFGQAMKDALNKLK